MRKVNWIGAFFIGMFVHTTVLAETTPTSVTELPSSEVTQLLKKMSETASELNYTGTFTYQHKDNPALQSFKIIHWVEKGIEHERLLHLNGPEREIVRSGKPIECQTLAHSLLLGHVGKLNSAIGSLNQLYKFEIRGPERIAGRRATVLLALPVDKFRYSYFLSIDDETGLVLKSWLVDEAARPLERYQFINLELNPDVQSFRGQTSGEKIYRASSPDPANCNPKKVKQPDTWSLEWIPPGFVLAGQRRVKDNIDMLMYTDGLATFSVFVQAAKGAIPQGTARRGATLAAMEAFEHKGKNYRVTVVGEIPVLSAQKIAQNVHGI